MNNKELHNPEYDQSVTYKYVEFKKLNKKNYGGLKTK